ncbi:exonuclease domain-containing protein [Lactobacillus sp. ESL0681]|uniref:exonuclease domain-containing protein n=1 Tax=Lactobacillus sp. ESL0681 TaxID=2983211 RepID=UPI0023F8BFF2|nr:exonuclease domain-containing protein [Lactobacillus sp. ESL0681]WEV41193.1 exonuclease domain-containing protein [Lactobacillus sp. ESL0681]
MSITITNGVLQVSGAQDKLRGKGCERPEFLSDYTLLDIETTGLSPYRDHVTELGAIKVRGGEVVDQYSQLVYYPWFNHVPSAITKLNGITEDQLLAEGIPVKTAMTQFRTFIGSDIIIGYNVNFDLNFLYDLTQKFHLPELNNDYVDVLRFARNYYPRQRNRLLDCIQRAGIAQTEQHHGLADSLDTKKVYDDFRLHFTPDLLAQTKQQLKNFDLLAETLTNEQIGFRNPVKNKKITFAPNLAMDNSEACKMVNNLGGQAQLELTADTDYLIVDDHTFFDRNDPLRKQVENYQQTGSKIKRLSEKYFLNMLDEWARK